MNIQPAKRDETVKRGSRHLHCRESEVPRKALDTYYAFCCSEGERCGESNDNESLAGAEQVAGA